MFKTFTKRQKEREKAGETDVFQYDDLPEAFRNQVIHIWRKAIGRYFEPSGYSSGRPAESNKLWNAIHSITAEELGRLGLGTAAQDSDQRCISFLSGAGTSEALDIIDVSFVLIDRAVRKMPAHDIAHSRITLNADTAIETLNHRFREHALGYQFVGGELIRVDSEFLHEEAVKPAIQLLNGPGFEGAREEFMNAHKHLRAREEKQAIAEALKAFESTMKAICDDRGWIFEDKAAAKDLIGVLFDHDLISPDLQSQFSALRSTLESGLPTVRNRKGGHGQGAKRVTVPEYLAAYALHLAAANIVLLVEAHKATK